MSDIQNEIDKYKIEILNVNQNKSEPFYHYIDNSNNLIDYFAEDSYINEEISFLSNFAKFSNLVNHAYMTPMSYNSTTFDLIALYLKGQKIFTLNQKRFANHVYII
jgi:hypothetical protein